MGSSRKTALRVNFIKVKDPSPVKDPFFTKGSPKAENKIEISIDGQIYDLQVDELLKSLERLKEDSNILINHLSSEKNVLFHNVYETVKALKETSYFSELKKELHKIFDSVKEVFPGTVASYFKMQPGDLKGLVPSSCDPKIVTSLLNEGTSCDHNVFILTNKHLQSLQSVEKSSHAYIYISTSEQLNRPVSEIASSLKRPFTKEAINQLKGRKISTITLIFGDKGNYTFIDSTPRQVDKLEPMTEQLGATSTTTSSTGVIAAVIILLIILLLIVVIGLYYYYSNKRLLKTYP